MSIDLSKHPPAFFIDGIQRGEMAVLSRAITLVESTIEDHQQLARKILEGLVSPGRSSVRLGITGVPGVGKSTFIESFGKEVLSHGHKLAVLAIDPSSSKSKGSILGDKTRMEQLSTSKDVYIRPSPSGGTLGGVTKSTFETILLCEAAGFDFIIIETVGVGQSETAVSKICDFFLLLMLAGAGDELQGIKRGIMEMADALVITKADGDNLEKARAARTEYAHALHLLQAPESGWIAQTKICSSINNTGITEIYEMLLQYLEHAKASGFFLEKRRKQQFELFLNAIEEQLKNRFYAQAGIHEKIEQIKTKASIQPFTEARKLLDDFMG